MTNKKIFLVIDDDEFSNRICEMVIKITYPDAETISFLEPELALDYLKKVDTNPLPNTTTIIFLDINMPTMTGWEFLDERKKLSTENIEHVFILSSSVIDTDFRKSREYECVDFIIKPFSEKALKNAVELISTKAH